MDLSHLYHYLTFLEVVPLLLKCAYEDLPCHCRGCGQPVNYDGGARESACHVTKRKLLSGCLNKEPDCLDAIIRSLYCEKKHEVPFQKHKEQWKREVEGFTMLIKELGLRQTDNPNSATSSDIPPVSQSMPSDNTSSTTSTFVGDVNQIVSLELQTDSPDDIFTRENHAQAQLIRNKNLLALHALPSHQGLLTPPPSNEHHNEPSQREGYDTRGSPIPAKNVGTRGGLSAPQLEQADAMHPTSINGKTVDGNIRFHVSELIQITEREIKKNGWKKEERKKDWWKKRGFVYIVEVPHDGQIFTKIGCSNNFSNRWDELKRECKTLTKHTRRRTGYVLSCPRIERFVKAILEDCQQTRRQCNCGGSHVGLKTECYLVDPETAWQAVVFATSFVAKLYRPDGTLNEAWPDEVVSKCPSFPGDTISDTFQRWSEWIEETSKSIANDVEVETSCSSEGSSDTFTTDVDVGNALVIGKDQTGPRVSDLTNIFIVTMVLALLLNRLHFVFYGSTIFIVWVLSKDEGWSEFTQTVCYVFESLLSSKIMKSLQSLP